MEKSVKQRKSFSDILDEAGNKLHKGFLTEILGRKGAVLFGLFVSSVIIPFLWVGLWLLVAIPFGWVPLHSTAEIYGGVILGVLLVLMGLYQAYEDLTKEEKDKII